MAQPSKVNGASLQELSNRYLPCSGKSDTFSDPLARSQEAIDIIATDAELIQCNHYVQVCHCPGTAGQTRIDAGTQEE